MNPKDPTIPNGLNPLSAINLSHYETKARTGSNETKRLRPVLVRILLVLIAIACFGFGSHAELAAQTTATYIGPNNGNWSNPANWDIGIVPINNGANTYNVIVPAGKIITYDIAGASTISGLNLVNTGSINITAGQSLNVSGFTLVAGIVTANGAGSNFSALSQVTAFSPSPELHASNGGHITVNASSYETLVAGFGQGRTILSADGNGSILDLSALTQINDNSGQYTTTQGGITKTISATNSGLIDLSNVTQIKSGASGGNGSSIFANVLEFSIASGGNIDLSRLETILNDNATGSTSFVVNVPVYNLPALQTANAAQFNIRANSRLNAVNLASLRNGYINLTQNGSDLNAPLLSDITGTRIDLMGGATLVTAPLTSINNSQLFATGGGTISVNATSYETTLAGNALNATIMRADGVGSTLDLSSLNQFSDNSGVSQTMGGNVRRLEAVNGGTIDLSGATQIKSGATGGPNVNQFSNILEFKIGVGSNINLSGLQSIVTGSPGPGLTRIWLDSPTTYSLPSLVSADSVQFILLGFGQISMPNLTTLTNANLDIPSLATISAPNLSDISGSYLRKSGLSSVITAPITNANNTQLLAHTGGVIDIAATTYSNSRSYSASFISALNSNSRINLNSVTNFQVTGAGTVEAASTGVVNLRAIESITGSPGGLRFLSQSGGAINFGGVSNETEIAGSGIVRFETTGTNSVIHFGSSMDMSANTAMKATLNGRFEAERSFIIRATNPANFDLKDGTLRMIGNSAVQGVQSFEVISTDAGVPTGTLGNIGQIGQLQIGTSSATSRVVLQDGINNNGNVNDREALYLQGFPATNGLSILNGSSLILNGQNAYTSDGQGNFTSLRSLIAPGQRFAAYDAGFIALTGEVGEVTNGDFVTGFSFNITRPSGSGGAGVVSAPTPGNPI